MIGSQDDQMIEVLDLSVRLYGYLKRYGIVYVRDIFMLNKGALMGFLKADEGYYQELKKCLIQRGFMSQDQLIGPFSSEEVEE